MSSHYVAWTNSPPIVSMKDAFNYDVACKNAYIPVSTLKSWIPNSKIEFNSINGGLDSAIYISNYNIAIYFRYPTIFCMDIPQMAPIYSVKLNE